MTRATRSTHHDMDVLWHVYTGGTVDDPIDMPRDENGQLAPDYGVQILSCDVRAPSISATDVEAIDTDFADVHVSGSYTPEYGPPVFGSYVTLRSCTGALSGDFAELTAVDCDVTVDGSISQALTVSRSTLQSATIGGISTHDDNRGGTAVFLDCALRGVTLCGFRITEYTFLGCSFENVVLLDCTISASVVLPDGVTATRTNHRGPI